MKIIDIVMAPIPPSPITRRAGRLEELKAPPRSSPAATEPIAYERRVFAFLLANQHRLGIRQVLRAKNALVDGGIVLDDGRFLAIEIKYRMNWPKACQAGWQIGRFVRSEAGQNYRPVGGIVFFEQFSSDWARPAGTVEYGWLHWYDYHARLPGDTNLRVDLVRFWHDKLETLGARLKSFTPTLKYTGRNATYNGQPAELVNKHHDNGFTIRFADGGRLLVAAKSLTALASNSPQTTRGPANNALAVADMSKRNEFGH